MLASFIVLCVLCFYCFLLCVFVVLLVRVGRRFLCVLACCEGQPAETLRCRAVQVGRCGPAEDKVWVLWLLVWGLGGWGGRGRRLRRAVIIGVIVHPLARLSKSSDPVSKRVPIDPQTVVVSGSYLSIDEIFSTPPFSALSDTLLGVEQSSF